MPAAQQLDQIKPAHSGHMLVDDETATVRRVGCIQKLSSRGIATDRETLDLKREFQGIANREVIVQDDHHEPRSRQFAVRSHRLARAGGCTRLSESRKDRNAALIWLNFVR